MVPSHQSKLYIQPRNLLSLSQRTPKSTAPNFNPHYFKNYTDRVAQNNSTRVAKDRSPVHVYDDPDEDGAYDNSQRHLSDFIMQQQSNLEQAPRTIPLLCLKSNRQQSLYVDFNPGSNQEEVDLIKTVKDMRDDPDLAALRIQCWWRTFLGKLEFEEMKKEHSRRERAAVRLQCMWRGRMGYANMLKMRAKNHDESDGAMRIQGLWRGKSSRQMFNEKRADLKAENDSACRIQSLYRGRQSRSETLRRKKAARSVVATTTAWGEVSERSEAPSEIAIHGYIHY